MRRLPARRRDEAGTAIIEFVWLTILLLVPLVYIVLAVFDTQRTSYATSTAARSAGRAFVTSPDEASAYARARTAARLAFEDQGIERAPMLLVITCSPRPGNCLSPGSVVVADVRSSVALPLMPDALGGNTPRIKVEAVNQSPYGTFREDRP
ncbi:MAG: TadE/TadG family type IV pilus assembly protein [Marmoricola sp.]